MAEAVEVFLKVKNRRRMSEDRGVHPDCRNASNPFHLCSNYCFNFISEANKGLNTTPGTTKVKDDGFGPNPTTPLGGEGDQSRNVLVDQSTLLASSDDEDNEAGNITNLTRRQKQTYKEAMKARQTATVQEKKIMESPEEMAQEKQPAPAGRDGEKFVNDFLTAFPPLTYIGDKAGEEIYAPPIPVKADINAQINTEDVSFVGSYPDHVVLSIANERDKLKAQLQQVMEETTKQKTMYQNQRRQAELWRAKYYAVANAPAHGPASHGQDSGVEGS